MKTKEELEKVIEMIPEGILVMEGYTRVLTNPAYESMLAEDAEENIVVDLCNMKGRSGSESIEETSLRDVLDAFNCNELGYC